MRSSAVFSVAFLAAAVTPAFSVPISSSQPTPTPTVSAPGQNGTAQVSQAAINLIEEFLSSLSPQQSQDFATIVEAALNSTNTTFSIPANPSSTQGAMEKRRFRGHSGTFSKGLTKGAGKAIENATESVFKRTVDSTLDSELSPGSSSTQDEMEKRRFGHHSGKIGKEAEKEGAKAAENATESAFKRTVEPTPIVETDLDLLPKFREGTVVPDDHPEPELKKRQWGAIFKLIGKAAAKAGVDAGKKAAESAIEAQVKRTPVPIPNAKRDWTPPAAPTPPPVPSCWGTKHCGRADLD